MATERSNSLVTYIHRMARRSHDDSPTDRELLNRFIAHRDEIAIAALVQRYGPLVLGVCRRVLRNRQDAEDAFQATFLVLLHKARAIADPGLLANWLYGVAFYVARNAKVGATRRQAREKEVAKMSQAKAEARDNDLWELKAVLDEELSRLPEKFRLPIILCELQGMSRKQVAERLGCGEGTLSSRLARARKRLHVRLTKRGLTLSAGAMATALSQDIVLGSAALPLVAATVRMGLSVGLGSGLNTASVPAEVAALTEGVLKTMLLGKLKIVTGLFVAICILAAGGTLTQEAVSARQTERTAQESRKVAQTKPKDPPVSEKPKDAQEFIKYSGRVLGQDDKPVTGAKLYVTMAWGYPHRPSPSREYATTGPDGRFTFKVPKAEFGDESTVVAAAAANHAVEWVNVEARENTNDLTIRLMKEEVPITGEIVDLEGKPVVGATLRLLQINAAPGDDLGPWLEASKGKKGYSYQLEQTYLKRLTIAVPMQVATDATGRFRLPGIGRNRLVRLQLDGPTIASQHLCILTRPGEKFAVTMFEGQPEFHVPRETTTYYGNSFRVAAAPTKPIVGMVRDRDTKKPLAGVAIRSGNIGIVQFDLAQTTTDSEGRYRLTGLPKAEECSVMAIPGSDQPYGACGKKVPEKSGLEPVTVDFELKRGIWIEGRITDKVTGKPIRTGVEYSALKGNPFSKDYADFESTLFMDDRVQAGREYGSYRVLGIPGPGLVAVYPPNDHYSRAREREDKFGTNGIEEPSMAGMLRTEPPTSSFAALARVNPAKGVDSVHQDITLDPGWSFSGTVSAPDGKPLAGSLILYPNGSGIIFGAERMKTAEFTAWFNPKRPCDILFQHAAKGLVGVAHPPKENGGSFAVRTEPGAKIAGRLLDANGQARAGVELRVSIQFKNERNSVPYPPYSLITDAHGRFALAPLFPGYEFSLFDDKGDVSTIDGLRSGETRNLGDLRQK